MSLRAWQDEEGRWRLSGVKRFITNGCGEVLLTLARSEAEERIAKELADADAKKAEAQKERDEFEHKNVEFDQTAPCS